MLIPKDMVEGFLHNTKNGLIKIVKYTDRNSVLVEFVNSGYRVSCKSQAAREGRITDRMSPTVLGVAMIGDGPYRNTINYKTTKEYKCWISMIYRCYDKSSSNYHRYGGRGVKVCDEWLNFQNFAKWYHEHIPAHGNNWQLDKDIKVDGNLIYGPDFCVFASPQENTENAISKKFKMKSPSGDVVEFYNMALFCRENGLTKSGLHRVYAGIRKSHRGWMRAD